MTNKSLLTASHVRYLLALKRLNGAGGIRGSDLAAELNLSKPSVHNMMDTFAVLEYIEKEHGGHVYLTEYGLQRACFFEEQYHRIKNKLFSEHETDESVNRAIYAMIAELSEEGIRCLA